MINRALISAASAAFFISATLAVFSPEALRASGIFSIRAASSGSDRERAESLCEYLLSRGYPAYIVYEDSCEVRSGPYDTFESADAHRARMIAEDKLAAEILDESALPQHDEAPAAGDYLPGRDVGSSDFAAYSDSTAKKIIELSIDLFGHPYKYGGQSVGKGIDCSYYVQRIFSELSVRLPRTAAEQFKAGAALSSESDLRVGDLVFFKKTYWRGVNRRRVPYTRINHVGIYIGDGEFIHATINVKKVTISNLSEPYYLKRYAGARRLL
ncbi:MAG: C40 family peptidase [Endomicrobiia bacterium]|nr:C40 family peptidase [Endomicrobiia bacterium]